MEENKNGTNIRTHRSTALRNTWLFYLGRALFRVLFATVGRWEVRGHENIPEKGGVIIAPNHISFFDPPLLGAGMKRPLHFMAKMELFRVPVLGFLIKRTNAFPVRRGQQDIGAFRTMQHLLEDGEAVLLFPEGTRSKDGSFGKARPGLGMIACTLQFPVVPVRIRNSEKLGKFARVQVTFGRPIAPPKEYTKESYLRFSEQVLEEIKKL